MSKFVNHYEVLQVIPGANSRVIDSATNALLTINEGKDEARKLLENSHKILSDETTRKAFDAELRALHDNVIGSYKVVRKMAEGSFGRVYEGKHIFLGERVCIKHNINNSPENTELFKQEAKAIWELRHYAIPAVRDMVTLKDGSCALIMSYIEGPTLFQVVEDYKAKKEVMDPENAAWIMSRVLDALRYLHYNGVVHGDIKPHNIIIEPEKHTAVLVDYGLASCRPTSGSKASGYTPMFASPESKTDLPPIPESDFFSLGVSIIWSMGGDVDTLECPKGTPKNLKKFIESLVVRHIKDRPNWDKIDLLAELNKVREKDFGRQHTNFKKL